MGKKEIQKILIKFFTKNIKPTDDQIHDLASKYNIDKHEFEGSIYELLSSFLYFGRYNDAIRKGDNVEINKEELKKGIEIEAEHTPNKLIAYRIALDHLAEMPDYYTRLIKMEKSAEAKKPINDEKEKVRQIIKNILQDM